LTPFFKQAYVKSVTRVAPLITRHMFKNDNYKKTFILQQRAGYQVSVKQLKKIKIFNKEKLKRIVKLSLRKHNIQGRRIIKFKGRKFLIRESKVQSPNNLNYELGTNASQNLKIRRIKFKFNIWKANSNFNNAREFIYVDEKINLRDSI